MKEEYFGSLQELYNVKSFEPSRMVYDNINGEEKMFQLGKRWLNRIFALTKSFFKEICGGHDVVHPPARIHRHTGIICANIC